MTDVNTFNDAKPFALDVKDCLYGANGMTFAKSIGERNDDSYDAGSNPRYKVIENAESESQYALAWNMGDNLHQLAKVLGLSTVISKKSEGKIGLKNKGTFSTLCHLGPDLILILSRGPEGKPIELSFRFGEYVRMIEACHDNYCDERLNPRNFMETSRITAETSDLMKKLIPNIKDKNLNKEVSGMISTSGPSFMMICMTFNRGHRLFNKLDIEMDQCFSSFNLYHGLLLKAARGNIIYENAKGKMNELTKDTAIDLLWGSSYILGNIAVGTKDDEVVLKVDLSIPDKPLEGSSSFYISNKPTDRRYQFSQVFASYPKWSKLTPKGTFKIRFTSLSQNDDKAMKAKLGADFKSVQDTRGVFVSWNGRYLGLPYWNSKKTSNWGAKQNCTPLRCDIVIENSHFIAENICKIQSDKSQIDLDDAHPVLIRLMDCFVGNIVNKMIQSSLRTAAQKADDNYKPVWTNQVFHLIQHGELPLPVRREPAPPVEVRVDERVDERVDPRIAAAAAATVAAARPVATRPAVIAAPTPTVPTQPATVNPVRAVSPPSALTSVSRIDIPATTRAVAQSDRDLIQKVQSFVTLMSTTDLAAKMTAAKTTTVPGHADLIDTLVRISELIQKIGTTH
jgi:hypothetical protein